MRIATFNVNGINGRLPVLLRWLDKSRPDVVCLQELKAPQDRFPEAAIRESGYRSLWAGQKSWNGVAILASRGTEPLETQRGLPGDPEDTQSRYLEAAVNGVLVACLYLPKGNPAPGPKFDYKLRWFERLSARAAELLVCSEPVFSQATSMSCPRTWMFTNPSDGLTTHSFGPRCGTPFTGWWSADGSMLFERSIRTSAFTRSGTTSETRGSGTRGCGSTIFC